MPSGTKENTASAVPAYSRIETTMGPGHHSSCKETAAEDEAAFSGPSDTSLQLPWSSGGIAVLAASAQRDRLCTLGRGAMEEQLGAAEFCSKRCCCAEGLPVKSRQLNSHAGLAVLKTPHGHHEGILILVITVTVT